MYASCRMHYFVFAANAERKGPRKATTTKLVHPDVCLDKCLQFQDWVVPASSFTTIGRTGRGSRRP